MRTNKLTVLSPLVLAMLATPFAAADDIFVDASVQTSGNGSSWAQAKKTLGEGLALAVEVDNDFDIIWVADGTYYPGTARSDTFDLVNNTQLLGGFEGNESDVSDRDPGDHVTILSGDISGDNSHVVVRSNSNVDDPTYIDGFTISDGNNDENTVYNDNNGGAGMRIEVSSGQCWVVRCRFEDNIVSDGGTAFSDRSGGALFVGNLEDSGGVEPQIINCEFVGNQADGNGGGIATSSATPRFFNCLFYDNHADGVGGAGVGSVYYVNCTVVENNADGSNAGGLSKEPNDGGGITNSIVWGNTVDGMAGTTENDQLSEGYTDSNVDYTTVEDCSSSPPRGICQNTTNDSTDPGFVGSPNFRLDTDSPAIDSGSYEELLDPSTKELLSDYWDAIDIDGDDDVNDLIPDLDDELRLGDCEIDKGAYESGSMCAGDANDDGKVDFEDILEILVEWGTCSGCDADVNCDGTVSFADTILVFANWGCGDLASASFYDDVFEGMDLDYPDDFDDFMDCVENGSVSERENCECWIDHYYDVHYLGTCLCSPSCPDDAPWGPHKP